MPWLWLAAAIAFSPSLVDLVGEGARLPRDRVSLLLAALLLLRASFRQAGEAPAPRQGLALLGLAVALQLFGIIGDASTLGRLSVSVAILGVSRIGGRPPLPAALLALWLVPIPVSLLEPLRAGLENAAAAWVAAVASLLDPAAHAVGPVVRLEGEALELRVSTAGVQLVHLLSLLGFYAAVRKCEPVARCIRNAALWGACGVALTPVCLALAGVALVASGLPLAGNLLQHGIPLGAAFVGFLIAERRGTRSA